jgi:hypothetical protein
MAKALSPEQAARVLRDREETAREEILALGFRETLYSAPAFVEEDLLRGVAGGFRSGEVYIVGYSTDGRRRSFSGISAVEVLDQLQGFLRFASRHKEDAPQHWVTDMSGEPAPAVVVTARQGSENARKERREVRRELVFDPTGRVLGVEDSSRGGTRR